MEGSEIDLLVYQVEGRPLLLHPAPAVAKASAGGGYGQSGLSGFPGAVAALDTRVLAPACPAAFRESGARFAGPAGKMRPGASLARLLADAAQNG